MKIRKITIVALLTISSMSIIKAETTFSEEFEHIKSLVARDTSGAFKELDARWHDVLKKLKECIDMSEKTNVNARTVKQLHAVAEKTKKQLIKEVANSTTKKHINNFKSVSTKADNKDDSHLKKVEHLVGSLHKHLKSATTHAVQGKNDSIAAHTDIQKDLVQEDKQHQTKKNHSFVAIHKTQKQASKKK